MAFKNSKGALAERILKGNQSSYLYFLLGECYYKMGNNTEATNNLAKALTQQMKKQT